MTPPTSTPVPRASALARFGPLGAVLCAIALVAVLASTGDGGGDGPGTSTTTTPQDAVVSQLPVTYAQADDAGTIDSYEWGPDCDPEFR